MTDDLSLAPASITLSPEQTATYATARAGLPGGAVWSSSFGYPGEGGYVEYWRLPTGERWTISNGPWHLCSWEFEWRCQKVEERS